MKKKLFALSLSLAMCMGLSVPAFATETSKTVPERVPSIYETVTIPYSPDAINTPSNTPVMWSNTHLFTLSTDGGTGFKYILPTSDPDYFYRSDITKGALKIEGTMGSTSSACSKVEVGYGLYSAITDTVTSVGKAYFKNNIYSEAYFTLFDYNTRYYGYASSMNPGQYVIKGTINFWNSDEY